MGTCVGVIVATILKQNATRIAKAIAALVKRRVGRLILAHFALGEQVRVASETLEVNTLATLLLLCRRAQRAQRIALANGESERAVLLGTR